MFLSTILHRAGRPGRSATRLKRPCHPELTRLEARTVQNADVLSVVANPAALWPPNGRLVPVTVRGVIADDDGSDIGARFRVRDEYGAVQPRGPVTLFERPNGRFSYSFTVLLQASRRGQDRDGRQYQILVEAFDDHSSDRAATVVTVPHDRGRKSAVGLPGPAPGHGRWRPVMMPVNPGDPFEDDSGGGRGNGRGKNGRGKGRD